MKKFTNILFLAISIAFTSCIKEDNTPVKIPPIEGAVVSPNVGGAAEPNQIWIELSTNSIKETHREDWDLGFYCGDEFRVIMNPSLVMAAGKIENEYNIDAVNSQTVAALKNVVKAANFQDNSQYIDNPNGEILTQSTGIAEIKLNDAENNVYLVNMGNKVYTGTTVPGTVYSIGEERGWKKIRVLRHPQGYKIQYADLDATSHKEFIITKDGDYNHRFFSLLKDNYADIQPKKKNWDLCFTVFTNLTSAGTFMTSYIYPDFVLNNTLGKVAVYEVATASGQGESAFNSFKLENIDPTKFVTNDQRTIGGNWRTTTGTNGVEVYSNKFYVLRNSDGFFFKLRFLRMKNEQNNRGYPQFEYKAL